MTGSASLSAMYQDALLAHYRAPRNRRTLAAASASGSRKNPLCGDEIVVHVAIEHGVIVDVAFEGRGCSIAVASASMLTEAIRALSVSDALLVADGVDSMLTGHSGLLLPDVLAPLRGVAPFPARHACAGMAWAALRDALRVA